MMPDYSDKPVNRVDNLHHVEGLISISDRVARRKEEQRRRKQRKEEENQQETFEESGDEERSDNIDCEEGHIDFRA